MGTSFIEPPGMKAAVGADEGTVVGSCYMVLLRVRFNGNSSGVRLGREGNPGDTIEGERLYLSCC